MPHDHEDSCAALAARHLDGAGRWLAAGNRAPFPAEVWHRTAAGGRAATAFPPPGPFDGILLRWPKSAPAGVAFARSCAARLAPGGLLAVVCPVDEGGKSVAGRLRDHFATLDERYGNHARLVLARGPTEGFAADPEPEPVDVPGVGTFASWPGLFAHGRLDEGTALFLRHLPPLEGARVLDFGCGAGVISAAALRAGAREVVAADVDALAIHAVRHNVPAARARLVDGVPPGAWDVVLSNPPLHTGHRVDDAMLRSLAAAPAGRVALVTLRTVPVAKLFAGRTAERVAEDGPYGVWWISGSATGTGPRRGSPTPSGP
jgi:16S rRNA (guanine1207-N2)-methyltransferase